MSKKVLVISHRTDEAKKLARQMTLAGYGITGITKDKNSIEAKLKSEKPDFIALDLELANEPSHLQLLARLNKKFNIPYIALANLPEMSSSILGADAIKGLWSYHIDSLELENFSLTSALSQSLETDTSAPISKRIPNIVPDSFNIVGKSEAFAKALSFANKVASTDVTVLLTGETGTGKEVFAKYIHQMSLRNKKSMIILNCAAIPENLAESELFGHEKGSFTGATEKRMGKFRSADMSSLFLDEIGELPLKAQAKLLRSLQEKEVESVGATETVAIDVRFIAATNRDLSKMVEDGTFRADLYFRLNIFPIHLPALRERKEDIIPLAQFFLDRYAKKVGRFFKGLSKACKKRLLNYSWPGNVRELQHMMERAVVLADTDEIDIAQVEFSENGNVNFDMTSGTNEVFTLEEIERKAIINALTYCKGKIRGKDGAATLLKVHPNTLDFKIKKLGIEKTKLFD
ncbi:sigma-54 dependent transcriptional regulator [Winogradskyella maritima]|uniref:Sigma-54 dependent transcriptional regulator n=1 Tax=Winogradskyella maritima TaxID=1517766 RepID=A0ABV8AH11_9FLAO|nr:sigma-54 dependent transcriptional regulator [Winogradskyella maritima]